MVGTKQRMMAGIGRWRTKWVLFVLAGVFLLQWALLMTPAGPTWDAAFYYAYTRSVIFDFDLEIENDLELGYPTASRDFANKQLDEVKTETGRVASPFAIGTSILWLPIYGLLRLFSLFQTPTGYEWFFSYSTAAFSALCGLLAFYLAYKITEKELSSNSALWATVVLLFTIPLLYYQYREPLYSHTSSALMGTLCIYVWWRHHKAILTNQQAILLGSLIGFAGLTRWQNVMYIGLPIMSASWVWLACSPEQRKQQIFPLIKSLFLVGLFALAVFSIQQAVWQVFYGSWVTVPQGGAYVDWSAPFWREVFFSPFRGLVAWMPVFVPALIGLFVLAKRKPQLIIPLLIVLLLETYVNSSTRDWFGGGGFGPRRYTSELAIFVLGYGGFLWALPRPGKILIGLPASLILIIHQWLLLRYGLTDRIGGRVVSMYPTYEWLQDDWPTYWQQLTSHLPDLINTPLDILILPGSPLAQWLRNNTFPTQQLIGLLIATLFLIALSRILPRLKQQKSWLMPAFITISILLINVWILVSA